MADKILKITQIGLCLSLGEAWFQCIKEVYFNGYEYTVSQGSFVGQKRKELDFVIVQIVKPWIRPLVPDVPLGVPPPADMVYIQEHYLEYLMSATKKPNEQYTYGEDLEQQIEDVIEKYKKGGFETNQACMTVGSKDSIRLDDPQCLRLIDTRIRYGKLSFIVYFRSWDLWGGFPSNLAAIQILKEYMVERINEETKKKVEDGEIIALSKGLHLYDHHWELAKMVLRV